MAQSSIRIRTQIRSRLLQKIPRLSFAVQQPLDPNTQSRVPPTRRIEIRPPRRLVGDFKGSHEEVSFVHDSSQSIRGREFHSAQHTYAYSASKPGQKIVGIREIVSATNRSKPYRYVPGDNSSSKNERAYAHNRRAERSDISSISAASASGSPVKYRSLTNSAA